MATVIETARAHWESFERTFLRSRPSGYVLAVVVTVATVLLRHTLDPVWGTTKGFMLFFPAVMVVGRLAGFGPGILATALSSLAVNFFWTEPFGRFHIPEPQNVGSFVVFVGSGFLVSALNGSLHASMRRAASLHDARETLLAIVAHDLRNPLSTIAVNVGLLQRGSRGPEGVARALGSIDRSVARIDRLIGDILDASKIESGTLDVVLREERAESLAVEALDAAAPLATAKHIELASSVQADLPAVRCDRERVLQILGNLLGNAIKFTPGGGKIALSMTREGPFAQLVVKDSGAGIEPRDLAHVFDRYWRKGSSGTGLGLYVVQGLAVAQGGRVWAVSERDHGTSIFVTLPLAGPGGDGMGEGSHATGR